MADAAAAEAAAVCDGEAELREAGSEAAGAAEQEEETDHQQYGDPNSDGDEEAPQLEWDSEPQPSSEDTRTDEEIEAIQTEIQELESEINIGKKYRIIDRLGEGE